MTPRTFSDRADYRSVARQEDVRRAGLVAHESFELLRRTAASLDARVPPVARQLMQRGLNDHLAGVGGAVLERPGNVKPQAAARTTPVTTPVATPNSEPVRTADARVTPIKGRGLDNPSV